MSDASNCNNLIQCFGIYHINLACLNFPEGINSFVERIILVKKMQKYKGQTGGQTNDSKKLAGKLNIT